MKSLDIETIPNESIVLMLPEPEIDSRLKDPVKIEAAKIESKNKQIEKMALSPMTGRICSYAVCSNIDDSKSGYKVIKDISDESEWKLITEIFYELNDFCDICTWNGNNFDLPFIYKRAAILGMKLPGDVPPLSHWTKRYSYFPHCDLMQAWSNWGSFDTARLGWVSKILLGEEKEDIDVMKFLEMLKNGEGDKIGKYNLKDAVLTMKIYDKLKHIIFD